MSTVTLRTQLDTFYNTNTIIDSEGDKNDCFNFYDWFCQDKSLERKARTLLPKVKRFAKEFNVDLDKTYVFFKNNCPMYGKLYDDFRICNIDTGNVIFTVIPKCGHHSTKNSENVKYGEEETTSKNHYILQLT